MSENVVLLIANIEVILAWIFCGYFIYRYARYSKWRSSTPGRTMMYSQLSMFTLLTYALTARWLQPIDWLNYILGLSTYASITIMQGFLLLLLILIQTGKITADRPDYRPIRALWRRLRRKDTDNG